MEKIIKRENLDKVLSDIKNENKTLVTTNGCFDILHTGHVKYLNESKKFGDYLMVLLNSDSSVKRLKGNSRPINNENDRAYILSNLIAVDFVVIFDEDSPIELLRKIKPDIHTKGEDYTIDTLPESKVILENGGRVEFIKFVEGKSTTNIIKKIGNEC